MRQRTLEIRQNTSGNGRSGGVRKTYLGGLEANHAMSTVTRNVPEGRRTTESTRQTCRVEMKGQEAIWASRRRQVASSVIGTAKAMGMGIKPMVNTT
jgi:hypothetical protein